MLLTEEDQLSNPQPTWLTEYLPLPPGPSTLRLNQQKDMHRIEPTEKDTDNSVLEKRLWAAANHFSPAEN